MSRTIPPPSPLLLPPLSPEPQLSANLYASGFLDEILHGVVVPFRQFLGELAAEDRGASVPRLWVMRYARNGEHLKLRAHLEADEEALARERLEAMAAEFFDRSGPRPEPSERVVRPKAPPMDVEDSAAELPQDRSLLFTRYLPSKISLGGEPYLSESEYRRRMVTALARATSLVLDELADKDAPLDHPRRQRLMLRGVIGALSSLGLSRTGLTTYATYHRDWIIREPILNRGGAAAEAQTQVDQLDALADSRTRIVEVLRQTLEAVGAAGTDPDTAWGSSLVGLRQYIVDHHGATGVRVDPFTDDPVFPPLIKVLHGLANILGLKRLDEALALHLIVRGGTDDPAALRRIDLTPP